MKVGKIKGKCAKLDKEFEFAVSYQTKVSKERKVGEFVNKETYEKCKPNLCTYSRNCEAYANAKKEEKAIGKDINELLMFVNETEFAINHINTTQQEKSVIITAIKSAIGSINNSRK